MTLDLKGKKVVVTGGKHHVERAIAESNNATGTPIAAAQWSFASYLTPVSQWEDTNPTGNPHTGMPVFTLLMTLRFSDPQRFGEHTVREIILLGI